MESSAAGSPEKSSPFEEPDRTVDYSGKTMGDFRLLRRIGQGGMGQVYLAEQVSLKRKVAIKIVRPELGVQATAFQRFKGEAEAIAKITHANIVQVYALGEEAGVHYMALEYVEGRNLREYLSRKGTMEVTLALSIMRQVAAALQRASELGIIHRDIKPENILLTRRAEAKVADFGLSRCFTPEQPLGASLTQSGVTMGTPLYMSPEQIQGQPLDPRTDIYSFGVTAYYMLAGHPPFQGRSTFELISMHVHQEPQPLSEVRPDLPIELCQVVHKMMSKDPAKRYQTCADLLKDLNRVREVLAQQRTQASGVQPLPAAPMTSTQVLETDRPIVLRKQTFLIAGTIAGALLIGTAAGFFRPRPAPTPEVPELEQPAAVIPSPEQRQEQALRESLELDANQTSEYFNPVRGVSTRVELGQLFLKQRRLGEAQEFFKTIQASEVEVYKLLGKLGQAMVLAYEDRAEESNKMFLSLLLRKQGERQDPLERYPVLGNNAHLRREISRALDYNKANATPEHPFPQPLERFRTPPKPPSETKGKGPNKKP